MTDGGSQQRKTHSLQLRGTNTNDSRWMCPKFILLYKLCGWVHSSLYINCIPLLGEPMMSLPVGWNLSGVEKPQGAVQSGTTRVEGIPVVQDPLGSSIMDTTVVHQQLMTDTQPEAIYPQCSGLKETMWLAERCRIWHHGCPESNEKHS